MVNCFVFFADPMVVGKLSALIKRTHSDINIIKIIDIKQIVEAYKNQSKDILITDYDCHLTLGPNNISDSLFERTLIIDEVEDEVVDKITYINKKFILTNLAGAIEDYYKSTGRAQEYVATPLKDLKFNLEYPCDIYVKISKIKYLKVLKMNSSFDNETLEKLLDKGVISLYIKKQDQEIFNTIKSSNSSTSPTALLDEENDGEIDAVESLHRYILDLGFDPKIIDLTKTIHKGLENKYSHKFMKKLFARFQEMQGSFLYNHSYLTSVIALSTGKKFSWMNFENKEKVYLGCILHDLGYIHKENALRGSLSKIEINNLPNEEKVDILEHPIKFARHLAQIDNIHQDVIKIVKDHHGVHGENSYPKPVYPAEVNLIFALFILSHELSTGLYAISFAQDKIPVLLDEICEKFNKGSYKKILPEFRQAVDEIFLQEQAA